MYGGREGSLDAGGLCKVDLLMWGLFLGGGGGLIWWTVGVVSI